jgi:nickel transport protein
MFRTAMIIIFAVCIFCSSALAHDIWVEKKDGKVVVLYGHADKNKFESIEPAKIKEAKGFDKNGKDVAVKIVQDKGILSIAPAKDLAAVTLFFDGGFSVKTTEGYKHVSKREVKEYIESMHSIKYDKTLFGWNKKFSKPLGMRLEIVPAKNPFDIKKGQALPVQVLFEGKPLVGATVRAQDYDGRRSELLSDKEGMANIVIEKAGIQIISARHKVPLKDNPDADKLSLGTALTFETK